MLNNLEKNLTSIGIFIDLKKAFDTVNHSVLLDKLYHYGLRGQVYNWFKDYFTGRKQFVQLGNIKSNVQNITCGVPQGSLIGPLMFLIYVNDMENAIKYGDIKMFADDTNIFYSGKDYNVIIKNIEEDLSILEKWFKVNKLAVNVKKCNYMNIQGRGKQIPNDTSIKLCNTLLPQVKNCKYLGVFLDEKMSWKEHVQKVCKRIRPIIGIISKIKYFIPNNLLKTLYYSLIHPHIMCCIESWGSTYTTVIEPVFILQKKIVSIISGVPRLAHTEPLFKKLNILPVRKLYFFHVCQLVYKELNNIVPLKLGFVLCSTVHMHGTRQQSNQYLYTNKHKSNYYARSISYTAVHFF